ncbi:hypothetical protein HpHA265_04110 [Helicobacter pylori]
MAEWKTDTEEVKQIVKNAGILKDPFKKKNAPNLSKTLMDTCEKSY